MQVLAWPGTNPSTVPSLITTQTAAPISAGKSTVIANTTSSQICLACKAGLAQMVGSFESQRD